MKRSLLVIFWTVLLYSWLSAQPFFSGQSQKAAMASNLSSTPLCFTENKGQWDSQALYKADAGGATFWFCKDEVVYQFIRDIDKLIDDGLAQMPGMPEGMPDKFNHPRYKKEQMIIRAEFVGANPNPEIIKDGRLSYTCNYFYGNDPSKWATDVPNFSSVTYKDLYPGIDLKYHGNGSGMKYDFIVNPGADISKIQIRYEGAENLSVTNQGELEAATSFGPVHENIPEVYQEIDGSIERREGRYIIENNGCYGFEIDDYNPNYPLIIDPELVYSTYLGGAGLDQGYGIAVDASGNAYVIGMTSSYNFPTHNSYQSWQHSWDAFITKLSPSGNSLVYSTYLGGNSNEYGKDIAVDASGNAYVTGVTSSSNFPTRNPIQTWQGENDIFIAKLSPPGNSLIYSTYLGGTDRDEGYGIAVDTSGSAYVSGYTFSFDFPIQNPYQGINHGSSDGIVAKLSPSGDSLVYCTYLGGSGPEAAWSIAVDASGCACAIGTTSSYDFPTHNPYQTDQSYNDAFITKLAPSGDSLVYSTYLGGDATDGGLDIAVDASGNAYVIGVTNSSDFPTMNPYQTHRGAVEDAFIAKLSASGNSLLYSTYLGGYSQESGLSIAVDAFGSAYVTGYTFSGDFPIQDPFQTYQWEYDAFVSKLSPSGNSLIYSTFLGGDSTEYGWGIAVDTSGNAYVTGETRSPDFPIQNPFQGIYGGAGYDAFVTKFGPLTGIDEDNSLPSTFSLSQNYPNPFNAQTIIAYSVSEKSPVTIDIFDIMGKRIGGLKEGVKEPGNYQTIWNASNISSGIYFYRLKAGDYQETKRMTLIK